MKYVDAKDIPMAAECGYVRLASFGVGTKAYLDTFAGMVPCEVTEIKSLSRGFAVDVRNTVTVEITKTVGAYIKGERIETNAMNVPPRTMRYLREYSYRINTAYCYNPDE